MRSLKNILRLFVHAFALPTVVRPIAITSITSCADVIGPPEAAASALVPVLETKIFVQSDERTGFESAAFDIPAAGKAILRAVKGAKIGASPRQRIQGAEITLNGDVVVNPNTFKKEEKP
jgi:hypothetical protein